ncbi:acyl-CoA dehydrogenase family protein [Nocardioides sp. cx-173]|uniref:acyl-CoA dehydrogenase family protein n=1 Tax=Nocardioides sp. cx-173 TaxID=2898796 RepID=UPI001E2D1D43|nr:acyl-CoA dehydrogenase family protein [Nocardioides sp. cx-173]MCD4524239.1 acyl-CoA/acyl-ACP dehydrogenase [Nocardioides sp. cx-173]UGB41631.1 acyl-CoA/acyl-ACP dehydrogenase [Nocardioides sp. cx-173]
MDFELTDEQQSLREVSRSMLEANCPPQLVRDLAESGKDVDDKVWQRGAELGWLGLSVPEAQGGSGQGLVELCLVAEELGRAGATGAFVDTALTAATLAQYGAFREVVTGLSEGHLHASTVSRGVTATPGPDGGLVLDGHCAAVHAAASADLLLVAAAAEGGAGGGWLVLVDASVATVTPRRTLDETRRWYGVGFDRTPVPATRILTDDPARVQGLQDALAVLTAADALGVGEWLLDTTVDYVKVREQFGRPLGSFQAVKHKAADMLITMRAATAATYYAAMALDAGTPEASRSASVAKAFVTEGASAVAGEALQTLGGIGFTWEHDLHLYLRRAKVDELLHGTIAEHHERVTALSERA